MSCQEFKHGTNKTTPVITIKINDLKAEKVPEVWIMESALPLPCYLCDHFFPIDNTLL